MFCRLFCLNTVMGKWFSLFRHLPFFFSSYSLRTTMGAPNTHLHFVELTSPCTNPSAWPLYLDYIFISLRSTPKSVSDLRVRALSRGLAITTIVAQSSLGYCSVYFLTCKCSKARYHFYQLDGPYFHDSSNLESVFFPPFFGSNNFCKNLNLPGTVA